MRFRPCIDIHNGAVKQIVGGSLKDEADFVTAPFDEDGVAIAIEKFILNKG